ncbi:MAG: hypothetical protein KC912_25615, partial [Proteobacteria bacterium]|nr:hypothetical protein [Pseudomonadota bacterium]
MKRTMPTIAAGVTLVAALCAGGFNLGVYTLAGLPSGAAVEAAPTLAADGTAPAPAPTSARVLSKRQYIEGILVRNIFDHTAVGKTGGGGGGEGGTMTDLAVRLLGTMVSSNADYSVATVVGEAKDSFPLTYGVGDKMQDATVIAIEQAKVTLRRGSGAVEYLAIDEEARPASRAQAKKGAGNEDDDNISKDGDNSYTVERDLVDKYLADLDALGRMGRAIPHRGPDGQIDGYRLSGIRRNSLGEKLGIRNGDIIHAANGQALTSMQGAMS